MSQLYLNNLELRVNDATAELPVAYREKQKQEGLDVANNALKPKNLEERKVLVIGGAGYIGVPLTASLLTRGYHVRCLDLLLYENRDLMHPFLGHPGYEFLFGDMADPLVVAQALDGVSDVIVLAGLVGDPITKKYPEESAAINDRGVLNVIEQLNGWKLNKAIFVSTCSNYGEIPADTLADENYALKPMSLYATSKVAAEKTLLGLKGKADFTGTVLRFSTAFGLSARMRFDLTVSEFTRDLFSGKAFEVYDADTWRPYCHVRDFASALIRVLEAPKEDVSFEVFNAGGDINNYTKEMVVDAILEQLPDCEVSYVKGGVDRRNYKVDFTKIRERLYFKPCYSVEDGVQELVSALKQGFFHDYEIRPNFYRNNEINYPL